MKSRIFIIAIALAFTCPVVSRAETIRVRQNGTEFTIEPKTGSGTVVEFYDYDAANPDSSDTGFELEGRSLILFYQRTGGPQPLAVVAIHDAPGGALESVGDVSLRFERLPTSAYIAVYDDPVSQGTDTYLPDPPFNGRTTIDWGWVGCCTDGVAIDDLGSEPFCLKVTPIFRDGVEFWDAGSGEQMTRTEFPSISSAAYFCRGCHRDFVCPDVVTAECDGAGTAQVSVVASGASACEGSSVSNDRTGGGADATDTYPLGSTQVTFTFSDLPGFTSSCVTTVIVEDTAPPVVDLCPAPLVLPCTGASIPTTDPQIQAWAATFAATDACGATALRNDLPGLIDQTCAPGQPTAVTFTATDDYGHEATCESSIVLLDDEPPIVSLCPAPIVVECDDPIGVPVTDPRLGAFFASFAAVDDCSGVSLTFDAPQLFPSACGPGGATTDVLFRAIDGCGLESTCQSSVTVRDSTPPEVACPSPLALECAEPGGVRAIHPLVGAWRQSFVTEDACGSATGSDSLPSLVQAACLPGALTPVTFTGTDDCGLSADCATSVTVFDTLPPAITVCPLPITLECSELGGISASDARVQGFFAEVRAQDICFGVTYEHDSPAFLPTGCDPGLETPIELKALDTCQNTSSCMTAIAVVDTTPPTITAAPQPRTLECSAYGGVPVTDPDVVDWLTTFASTDSCSAAITEGFNPPAMLLSGCAPGRTTTITYRATDDCGNEETASADLTVADTTAPAVTATLMPLIPLLPAPPMDACEPPTSRLFRVDCGAEDTCDASVAPEAHLIVTHHVVPAKGVCERIIEDHALACGAVIELALDNGPCSDSVTKPSRNGLWDPDTNEAVQFPFPRFEGEEFLLVVTAADSCGNDAQAVFDPRLEPSPICDQQLLDGTCCPAVAEPEKEERCHVALCGRCDAELDPPPVVTTPGLIAAACGKKDAQQAALDRVGQEVCIGPADPLCAGLCRLSDCSQTSAKDGGRVACRQVSMPGCDQDEGHECVALGDFECGCRCY